VYINVKELRKPVYAFALLLYMYDKCLHVVLTIT